MLRDGPKPEDDGEDQEREEITDQGRFQGGVRAAQSSQKELDLGPAWWTRQRRRGFVR